MEKRIVVLKITSNLQRKVILALNHFTYQRSKCRLSRPFTQMEIVWLFIKVKDTVNFQTMEP